MNQERIIKKDGVVFISEQVYANTPNDFKDVWSAERWDWPDWEEIKDSYMGKRTWMPPFWLFNKTCLLVEGQEFEILSDQEWDSRFAK